MTSDEHQDIRDIAADMMADGHALWSVTMSDSAAEIDRLNGLVDGYEAWFDTQHDEIDRLMADLRELRNVLKESQSWHERHPHDYRLRGLMVRIDAALTRTSYVEEHP